MTRDPLSRLRHWLLLPLIALGLPAAASHLVGGDVGYEYLGETFPGSGQFQYKLKMRMYLNCGASSNWPQMVQWLGGANVPLRVGVYNEDPANPDANKQLNTIAYVYLQSYSIITPDIPDSCVVGDGQCVEESLFEGTVTLPASTGGYHLYFQGYSRNAAILNLFDPGNAGFGIYAFIPPTAIVNSSPSFTGVPVPFICVEELTSFSNAAIDPDGDQLVFSFEAPYDSQDDIAGIIDPPNPELFWPIAPVVYLPGFNPLEPFGANGTATIDANTGAAQYSAPVIGNWAVAVEVKEYRNGVLIGRIKSDMQLLSLPCADNEAPQPSNGTLITEYSVNAGDTLCFPLVFVDADGDTVNVDANGTIFDPALFDPPAAIIGAAFGDSTVTTSFCWPTVCDQGQAEPYTFTVVAYDGACPPGVYSAVITVDVIPAGEQLSISGPLVACAGQDVATYCAEGSASSYTWSVNGGTITTPLDQPCITVDWDQPGVGSLNVSSQVDDCVFESNAQINVVEPPTAAFTALLDTTCTGVRVVVENTSTNGATAQWTYNGQPWAVGPQSTFIIPFSGNGAVQLNVTDANGCTDQAQQSFAVAAYDQLVQFSIPNVFSPNGDGLNDRFELITTQDLQECYTMQVFDRWGKEVYSNANGKASWGGAHANGSAAAEGVYYYILKVDEQSFHGHVSLMR
mgnify:CR=1 FL=1